MTGESGQEYDIYFSKIAGEKSTFVMIGEHAEYFGEHAPNYEDYFTFIQMA
jgi:hypothetical protein